MENPFTVRELESPGLVGKLLGRDHRDNAYIALENLLAAKDWNSVTTGDVTAVLREHGAKEVDRAKAKELYAKALRAFIADETIADDEAAALLRLRDLLGLTDLEIGEVEENVVDAVFDRALNAVVDDEQITDEERARLEWLRRGLRIRERRVLDALQTAGSKFLDQQWSAAMRDHRLTDDEIKAVEGMASNFGLHAYAVGGDKDVDRFRAMWLMENGRFPEVKCAIVLHEGEVCHHSAAATLFERRTETIGYQYSGLDAAVPIMKGLTYRGGTVYVQPLTRDIIKELDSGTLYFTSKRLIFDGVRGNRSYDWNSLIGVTPYSDGMQLERSDGPNPYFKLDDPEYAIVLVLSRLMH